MRYFTKTSQTRFKKTYYGRFTWRSFLIVAYLSLFIAAQPPQSTGTAFWFCMILLPLPLYWLVNTPTRIILDRNRKVIIEERAFGIGRRILPFSAIEIQETISLSPALLCLLLFSPIISIYSLAIVIMFSRFSPMFSCSMSLVHMTVRSRVNIGGLTTPHPIAASLRLELREILGKEFPVLYYLDAIDHQR